MSGDEKPAARLPRGIRENAGLFQFIMMRFVVTSITVAFLLLGGFYWPIPEMAGMVAAQLWMLTARSHSRDGDPLRPLSNPWKREEPTAEQGRRIVAALASEEWRAIKRRWYAISAAACIAIWIAAPIVKHAVNEIEPYAALRFNAMNGIVIIFGFGGWISLMRVWYATLMARFLKRVILGGGGAGPQALPGLN